MTDIPLTEIYESLSRWDKYTILVLAADNEKPINNTNIFHRIMLTLSNEDALINEESDYHESDKNNPYSEIAENSLEYMISYGLVTKAPFTLTENGRKIAKKIKRNDNISFLVSKIKSVKITYN